MTNLLERCLQALSMRAPGFASAMAAAQAYEEQVVGMPAHPAAAVGGVVDMATYAWSGS
jgi:hypothetical protein